MLEGLRKALRSALEKITKAELKPKNLKPILEELELMLLENDVALPVAEALCSELMEELTGVRVSRMADKKAFVKEALRKAVLHALDKGGEVDLRALIRAKKARGEPFSILFVGFNGTGKTTTIAKVAKMLKEEGFKVVLACSDTFRAGAIEQLEEHGRRLGIRVLRHRYGADPAAVAYDAISHARARGIDVVLIDTAGRVQTDKNLMAELAKIKRVIEPDLTILVVDALAGNDAAVQAELFDKGVGIDGAILTKVDADVRGGAALSVAYVTGKPII
ncbi:MAG TPA: signal recognition particle-docking protein FtsY, partial [Candidatus Bathyarchaeota archaeon]|nr:signal recognition particle-docking protein FtsY [Candidatus Bathyarchaeota archaeon]HEW89800.1 signal recognition particle-docking protein FtsY [Candidatus Bathyarchaeota archaeon]